MKLFIQDFKGHRGRKGKVGGSLPSDSSTPLPSGSKYIKPNTYPMVRRTHSSSPTGISSNSMYGEGVYFSDRDIGTKGYGDNVFSAHLKPSKQIYTSQDTSVPRIIESITGMKYYSSGTRKAMVEAGVGSIVFPVDNNVYTLVFDESLITDIVKQNELFIHGKGFHGHKGRPGQEGGSVARRLERPTEQQIQTSLTMGVYHISEGVHIPLETVKYTVELVPVNRIITSERKNPLPDLIDAYRQGKRIQPISAIKVDKNKWKVLDGNHRLKAARLARIDSVWIVSIEDWGSHIKNNGLFTFGGPGSGHHGHQGRPDKVGGSLPHSGTNPETEAFKKWFKGSKVVDKEGNPLIVYHGTSTEFDEFDENHHRVGGHWFSVVQEDAEGYAGMGEEEHLDFSSIPGKAYQDADKVIIVSAYLSIQNPASKEVFDKVQGEVEDPNLWMDPDVERKAIEVLKSLGYDGIDNDGEWAAFDKYQIKIVRSSNVKRNSLFHFGGPGSGYHGHRGRPGKVGGSAREGSVPSGDTSEAQRELDSLFEPKPKGYHRKRVEDIVRRLGYPVDKVKSTEDDGYEFTVNGQLFRTGAEYNPRTGIITIYDIDTRTDQQIEGMLAHEVQHSRWKQYQDEYQREFTAIQDSIHGSDNREDWLIRMDGSLSNPKDKKKYWAYDIYDDFLAHTGAGTRWERLQKTDGISAYSKQYWKQANASGSAWDYDRAVDETLAEIARIKVGHARPGDKKAIRPIWASLYNRIQVGTGVKQNSLFLFRKEEYV